jgi:hypothetical protein
MSFRFLCSALVLLGLAGGAQAGMIEICKDANPAGSLSGLATFTIAGQAATVVVPVGACSPALEVPDGFATITELPQADASLLGVSVFPNDRLISFDPATATAVVLIVAGDISTETAITFTNAPLTGVPEPATGWLTALGLASWVMHRTFRNARRAATLPAKRQTNQDFA